MLGLFDSPRLKAQRRAANAARSNRELAGREASLEVDMLARRLHWGAEQRDMAFRMGRAEAAGVITLTLADGQGLFDRLKYGVDPILNDTQERWRTVTNADQFEALATHEQELRDLLIGLRDQARLHLSAIGAAAMNVEGDNR